MSKNKRPPVFVLNCYKITVFSVLLELFYNCQYDVMCIILLITYYEFYTY